MSMCALPLEVDDQDLRELERLSRSVSEPVSGGSPGAGVVVSGRGRGQ